MSSLCMPTECPRQIVTPVSTTKTSTASIEKVSGPPISATSVMALVQIDLPGTHTTLPLTGSLSGSEIILPVDTHAILSSR